MTLSWSRLPLLLALLAPGCRSTEVKPSESELVVPKLLPDAGATSEASSSPAPSSTAKGWMVRPERGTNPIYTDRAAVLEVIKKAAHRAVLVHDDKIEECSSTGGSHAFFTMTAPRTGVAHYGGHGTRLMHAFEKGKIWVASVEPLPSPESVKNEGFCVPDRMINARATAMVPVSSPEEGTRLLEELDRAAK